MIGISHPHPGPNKGLRVSARTLLLYNIAVYLPSRRRPENIGRQTTRRGLPPASVCTSLMDSLPSGAFAACAFVTAVLEAELPILLRGEDAPRR